MTVLKGPLAVKQSKALIRTFKKMKDYILENRDLIGQRELLQLSMETANNRIEISKINSDMISLEKQISDVAEGLKDVVTKSELADMMNSFISDDDENGLCLNAELRLERIIICQKQMIVNSHNVRKKRKKQLWRHWSILR